MEQRRAWNAASCRHRGAAHGNQFDKDRFMKALVEYLAKSLVDHPEEVLLAERHRENTVILEIKVATDDIGKIIGKNGNTINAIRTVLQAAASSHKLRAKLDVLGADGLVSAPEQDNAE
jgi:hypothetical protein